MNATGGVTYHSSCPSLETKGVQAGMFSQWCNIAVARFSMFTLMGLTWPLLLELEDEPPIELGDISEIGSLGNLYDEGNLS